MKKKKLRIALAICPDGSWNSCGGDTFDEKTAMEYAVDTLPEGEKRYIVEVEVEVPTGEVETTSGIVQPYKPN